MVILRTTDPNTVNVDARSHTPGTYSLQVHTENTNELDTSTLTNVSISDGVATFQHSFSASESTFLYCKLFNDNVLIASFKCYVTDQQNLQNYSINDGRFVSVDDKSLEFTSV